MWIYFPASRRIRTGQPTTWAIHAHAHQRPPSHCVPVYCYLTTLSVSMIGWLLDVEQLAEWQLAGETEARGLGSNPGRRSKKPPTDRLRYGKAPCYYYFLSCFVELYFCLRKLSLHSLRKQRRDLDPLFLFRHIEALNPALPAWKLSVFVFLPAMLGTPQRSELVPLINTVLLLGAPVLPMRWVEISTYL
jgi:hypothetical protein